MRKILLLTLILSVSWQTGIYAQSPRGGRPGGGNRGMMGPPPGAMNHGDPGKLILDHFPDIPGLTLDQRTDIGVIMQKEHEEVSKLMQKKQQLLEQEMSAKEKKRNKIQKDIEKTDQKIVQQIDKSNKKIKKILSDEQYRIFMEKRAEFQFRRMPAFPQFNGDPDARPRGEMPPGGRPPGGGGGRR